MPTSFIEHNGTPIALFDFSDIRTDEEALTAIEDAWGFLADRDPESVCTITDVTGSTASAQVAHALFKLARENRPFVKAAAIVGADDSAVILKDLVTGITRRQFGMFGDIESAKQWLAEQG